MSFQKSFLDTDNPQTAPEKIRAWVEKEFNPKYVEAVTMGLIKVAEGSKEGNSFEKQAIKRIFNQ